MYYVVVFALSEASMLIFELSEASMQIKEYAGKSAYGFCV